MRLLCSTALIAAFTLVACSSGTTPPAHLDSGAGCTSNSDCPSDFICSVGGTCQTLNADGGVSCVADSQCPAGSICNIDGVCEAPEVDGGADGGPYAYCFLPDGGFNPEHFCCYTDADCMTPSEISGGDVYCLNADAGVPGGCG